MVELRGDPATWVLGRSRRRHGRDGAVPGIRGGRRAAHPRRARRECCCVLAGCRRCWG
jgi:hypothetical protein